MRNAFLKNILWGIRALAWYALAAWLIAVVAFAIDGTRVSGQRMPNLGEVALFYAAAAIGGGIVLGLCRPIVRTSLGKGVAGFLTALPIAFVVIFLNPFGERVEVDGFSIGLTIFFAALFGPASAAYVVIRSRGQALKRGDA